MGATTKSCFANAVSKKYVKTWTTPVKEFMSNKAIG